MTDAEFIAAVRTVVEDQEKLETYQTSETKGWAQSEVTGRAAAYVYVRRLVEAYDSQTVRPTD